MTCSHTEPWKDKDRLEELHVEKALPYSEIAEKWGTTKRTIRYWSNKFGLQKYAELRDREWMCEMYVERGLSEAEIADEVGCYSSTVHDWLVRHGIETRTAPYDRPPCFMTETSGTAPGYELIRHDDGECRQTVLVHRLVMVAEHGLGAIRGKHVHHCNEIEWDNRPENLELVTPKEHKQIHTSND